MGQVTKLQLLRAEPVQKELELLDDQLTKIDAIAQEGRGQRGGGGGNFQNLSDEERAKLREEAAKRTAETNKKVDAVLLDHQKKRLQEIWLQAAGTGALNDAEVAKELAITEDQKTKLADASREAAAAMREAFQGGDFNAEKMAQLRKESTEKTLAVLTSEQKDKFEKMQGKKVTFDLAAIVRGGRGQRRGGGGGNQ
jgi:Spy/CpxP family protein refolding chaperone